MLDIFNPSIVLPVTFGNERALANELKALGYADSAFALRDGGAELSTEPARFAIDVARLNINSRIAERVWLSLGKVCSRDFDALFDGVFNLPWQHIINDGGVINVTAYSRNSTLTSLPALQSIVKKAICKKILQQKKLPDHFALTEDPRHGTHHIQLALVNDNADILLDTSGYPLHKRGYRKQQNLAPLRETTAAAMLHYAHLHNVIAHNGAVVDLFTGSGTLAIEACQMILHMAPGVKRGFAGETLNFIGKKVFDAERQKAIANYHAYSANVAPKLLVLASDIDTAALEMARQNAKNAGVLSRILFHAGDSCMLSPDFISQKLPAEEYLFVGNPPYGERMSDAETSRELMQKLSHAASAFLAANDRRNSLSLISNEPHLEKDLELRAHKKRKMYNGSLTITDYFFVAKNTGMSKNQK